MLQSRELGKKTWRPSGEISRGNIRVNRREQEHDDVANWLIGFDGSVVGRFGRMFVNHAANRARVFIVIRWEVLLRRRDRDFTIIAGAISGGEIFQTRECDRC